MSVHAMAYEQKIESYKQSLKTHKNDKIENAAGLV
jgi:hypothetical protein